MSQDPVIVKQSRTTWSDSERRWSLGGWAADMYQWLNSVAPGSGKYRGWELAGTLDPETPDPSRFRPPPPWLDASILMQSVCAWYAGGLQDALVASGAVPLARLQVAEDGALAGYSGADVEIHTGRVDKVEGMVTITAYYVVVNQRGAYPLTDSASIQVTGTSLSTSGAGAVPIANAESVEGFDLSNIRLEDYRGFLYSLKGISGGAYAHLYC